MVAMPRPATILPHATALVYAASVPIIHGHEPAKAECEKQMPNLNAVDFPIAVGRKPRGPAPLSAMIRGFLRLRLTFTYATKYHSGMQAVTDKHACENVAFNLSRILGEQGRTIYWLMKEIKMSPGALYPIARGVNVPNVATAASIAKALSVTVDDLLKEPQISEKKTIRKKLQKSA
jgi:DNA-binding XRE family transcriptional regulator